MFFLNQVGSNKLLKWSILCIASLAGINWLLYYKTFYLNNWY